MNLTKFYSSIRSEVSLTTQNVLGFDRILTYGEERKTPLNHLAYLLATTWWETNKQMWPVREAYWLSEAWRKRNLRYFPWYGRGLVQITWEANYKKLANILDLPEDTFTKDPDKLLQWDYALPALFIGAEQGIYTGKKLSDYIDDIDETDTNDYREYFNARRVVNGTDKAAIIAGAALKYEQALKFGGYGEPKEPDPFTETETENYRDLETPAPKAAEGEQPTQNFPRDENKGEPDKPEPPVQNYPDEAEQGKPEPMQTAAQHYRLEGARVSINNTGMAVVWERMKEMEDGQDAQ